ncbi:MAG: radical SAM protein [Elusimicrobia bacterium]|nr:radical SAM protein [Elusimicrobiota bacterium]
MLPIYRRIPVEEAVNALKDADIVFFSMYVWNSRISLEIAKSLKKIKPEILTIFGGPHVPDRSEEFLRKNNFIEIACHNEGEQAFVSILENGFNRRWDEVPSISYLSNDSTYHLTHRAERIKDLSVIPSPYLNGIFDPLIQANPNEQWLFMWETNRGCPFSCTFCDWGSATQSKVFQFDMDRLVKELEWVAKHKIEFMFCADANFGILPRDLDIVRTAAEMKRKFGYPQALSVQNTKNATERAYQVQKTLAESGLNKGVTIAFQSVDPTTLKNIKRDNISSESFRELQRRFTRDGIETYSDMILGLPGETYDSFADGVSSTIENGQHNRIQFGNLSILPNAEMGDPEYQKKYGMETIEIREVIYHGIITTSNKELSESSQLVIATNTTPRKDWVRSRAFAWMTALLHFDKILQIPLVLLHETSKLSYRELIEIFTKDNLKSFPTCSEIRDFFVNKAAHIQNGGEEYCPAPEYLNIWWPADEYIFIKLTRENKLEMFYQEAERALLQTLVEKSIELPKELLSESIKLNRSLIKLPLQTKDLDIELSYNIWDFYQSVLRGKTEILVQKPTHIRINRTSKQWFSWDEWEREVVWYGNKKGAYLYSQTKLVPEMEGHF